MKIYFNRDVAKETLASMSSDGLELDWFKCNSVLAQDSWIVSTKLEEIRLGIEAGCQTIYTHPSTEEVRPSLFAPSVEDAVQFIVAHRATY